MSIYELQYIIIAMKKLEKMDEVKKPSSRPDDPVKEKKPKIPTPLFLLLCHVACIGLFVLAMLADWSLGDVQAQNITGTAAFLLPLAVAVAVILWSVKIPPKTRLSSPAFMICCFLAIALIWIVVYSQFSGMRSPAAISPDAQKDILWKEYTNDIRLSVFFFGLFYTAVDSVILFLYFMIRWIINRIQEGKRPANKKTSKK